MLLYRLVFSCTELKMFERGRADRCSNPLKIEGHKGKDLRFLCSKLKRKFPYLPNTSRICSKCRKKCASSSVFRGSPTNEYYDDVEDIIAEPSAENIATDNVFIREDSQSAREIELEEMLLGLKEKYSSLSELDPLRVRILTIAPSSWSINKIASEFNTSKYFARMSKNLKSMGGVLAETTSKTGKKLPENTISVVHEFYNNDQYSRMMPGRKDCVSVNLDGKRTSMQKRLLLFDLRELYELFKKTEPTMKLGFSTFAKLRPKHCIFAGARGTHSVCVCTIHQNCKLILDAIEIQKLTRDEINPINNYKDCIKQIMCENSTPECHLDECSMCPGLKNLSSYLLTLLNHSNILQVEYSAWSGTDRSTLQTLTLPVEEFIDELCHKLEILKPHSFIAKEQSNFIAQRKNTLDEGEVMIMFDYSENYAFAVQDASQAFHFNNDQCTVFPTIYYYKENLELKHESCIFLSNSLKHDTASVYTIQNLLIPEIKKKVESVRKIIYVTDGAKQHFKNRFQIANLINHEDDFGVKAEWHFCATAHGKSCYDGLGAIFKREAFRASLVAKPKDAILTHDSLVNWAKHHFKNIKIFYFTSTEHEKFKRKLNRRFQNASPVPNILKNHSFQTLDDKKLLIKRYSNASEGICVTL